MLCKLQIQTCFLWIVAIASSPEMTVASADQSGTEETTTPSVKPEETFAAPDEVRKKLDDILSRPEYRRVHAKKKVDSEPTPARSYDREMPEWLRKFLDWLSGFFGKASSASSAWSLGYKWIVYLSLLVIAGLIVWMVVIAVRLRREKLKTASQRKVVFESGTAALPPGELAADVYLRRAKELADRGMFREAIGQLVLGAMSYTERSGLIRFRRGLTHRDYLRALRGQDEQKEAFRSIVSVYEPICYGRRPALFEHFETTFSQYETGFCHG